MKGWIVLGIVILAIVLTVTALNSAMGGAARHPQRQAGVTGPLEVGAVSRAKQAFDVWAEARGSISAEDRRQLKVTTIRPGEVFEVLNHVPGDHLWLEVVVRGEPERRGWVRSLAHEPIRATRLE